MDKGSEIYKFYLKTKGGSGIVGGKSMYPALDEGCKIKVEPVDENRIKVGDIVLFSKDTLICHRIIGKVRFFGRTYFIHKGDNSSIGGIFEVNDLVGKAGKVFEKNQGLTKERLQNRSFNKIKIRDYIYLLLYLVKRLIWGEKTNRLSCFVNKYFWKVLT